MLDGLELEERAGDWTLQPLQVRVALALEEAGADLPRLGVAHVGDRVGRLGPQEATAQEAEDVVQRDRLRLAVDLEWADGWGGWWGAGGHVRCAQACVKACVKACIDRRTFMASSEGGGSTERKVFVSSERSTTHCWCGL